ncbi:MAG: hypothetical protein NC236_01510 [Mycoplasma sp.]|nr:hypothetical protein [Mycoplasma sp.]
MLRKMTLEEEANTSGGFLFVTIIATILATAWVGASIYKMFTADSGSVKLPLVGGEAKWDSKAKPQTKETLPPTVYVY